MRYYRERLPHFLNAKIYKCKIFIKYIPMSIYAEVNKKRKSWVPVDPKTKDIAEEGTDSLLSRCLALRVLEIPVREFILDGLSRHESQLLGQEGVDALTRNTEDEDRHDIALSNCVAAYPGYQNSYESVATQIMKAWVAHPDHPIAKAAVLENGIFFAILPLMRRFGGASLRTSSVDISADEVGHVILHRHAANTLGYGPSSSLDQLRKATIDWIAGKFSHPQIDADRIRSASDSLMYKGVAPELEFTQSYQVPAFFERANDSLPYYSA